MFLGRDLGNKNAPQELFCVSTSGAPQKVNLVLVAELTFSFSFTAHPPIALRPRGLVFLGRDLGNKNAPQELFCVSTSGAPQKVNLVLVAELTFSFSFTAHPPIALRPRGLVFLGRDLGNKNAPQELFCVSTSGAPQKVNLVLVAELTFSFSFTAHPPIALRPKGRVSLGGIQIHPDRYALFSGKLLDFLSKIGFIC